MSNDNNSDPESDTEDGELDEDVEIDADPFDELGEDTGDGLDDPFTEMEVEEIDEEDVWEEITGEESAAETETMEKAAFAEESAAGAAAVAEEDETIVEKSSYCQQCEFFSEPPEVACTNPGTEIVELIDTERFRVRNCPIVRQRRGTTEEVLED